MCNSAQPKMICSAFSRLKIWNYRNWVELSPYDGSKEIFTMSLFIASKIYMKVGGLCLQSSQWTYTPIWRRNEQFLFSRTNEFY